MQKIVIVGFGFMGVTHAMSILKNPDAELAAIVDIDPGNALKNLGNEVGNLDTDMISEEEISGIRTYTSLEECIAVEKPDASIISVHTDLHYSIAKLLIEKGVHVFVEKPVTLNIPEGEELIRLAEKQNLLLMVGHVVRFMPPYLQLKQWIDSSELGKLKWLSMTRFSGLPAWGQWKEKLKDFGSTGGALFDLVIHDIDFVQWVLGKPDTIQATCLPGKLSDQDYVTGLWNYSSGTGVKIEGGNRFHANFPFEAGYVANFENASIKFSSSQPENIIVATDSETRLVPAGDAMEGYQGEMDYFIECMEKNEKPVKCLPVSALQSIKICYDHL
ncbi:MAG: Gfo/Idh/MocA family oxidoreductase [Bacteroidota bacterium]